ncbi:MAG: InlB B-repeat-containing protein, partial [Clostridia bacterium]|nr:InlB B-repeat-containing protein [Clostridia bacterium]
MKTTSRINRILALFIAVVMTVSLMPLEIVAETVDSETLGISESETLREEENGSDILSDLEDETVPVEETSSVTETATDTETVPDGNAAPEDETASENEASTDGETVVEDETSVDETILDGETVTDVETVVEDETSVDETAADTETVPDGNAAPEDKTAVDETVVEDETSVDETILDGETVTDVETVVEDETSVDGTAADTETVTDGDAAIEDETVSDVETEVPAENGESESVVTDNITLYSALSNVSLKGELPVDGSVSAEKHIGAGAVENKLLKGIKNLFGIRSSDSVGADLASYDITIYDGSNTLWQPEDGKTVEVTIYDESFESVPFVNVYHEGENGRELVAEDIRPENGSVTFNAAHFSVYVVVESTVPRLTVTFKNGDSEIESMIIKASDTEAEVEKIIWDPGAGTVPNGQVFKGWTTDPDYIVGTSLLTIAQVRADAMTRAAALEGSDDSVTYYAAIFKQFNITYKDGAGIVVGSAVATVPNREDTASYTVNQNYTTDDTHNLEGWMVANGKSNFVDPSPDSINTATEENPTVIPNGTTVRIKGDITLSVSAPEGHWLVFDENGKGGTYNAPRFIKSGEVTSNADLLEMVRNGYTFGGWYTDAACTDGNEFTFGGQISDTTTIYAKWTATTTAQYTVIIWKQNLAGDGYDFVEAVHSSGTVGSTPTAVNASNGRVTGANYNGETGFSYKETDQSSKTIAPEGNTVVNVSWDRNEYTLQFQILDYTYTPTTGNGGTQYGLVDGEYVALTRHGSNNNYYWTYGWGEGTRYNGTRYTRSNNQSWTTIKSITALYGQSIGDNFPIVGSNGETYDSGERWAPQNSSTYNQVLVYIDTMPAENVTFHLDTANHSTKNIYYYVEALPGQTAERTYNGKSFVLHKHMPANYGYFTEAEDYLDFVGFNKYGYSPTNAWDGASTVYCYYTRKIFSINFMDGIYADGNNNPLDETSRGQLHEVNNVVYGSDLSSYNKGGADYYTPSAPEGYVFEGWYIDVACTQPYTFTTMPEGGITVYAKWRQIQYRVFLHPNAGTDSTLDWGSENQAMNFRVSYGGKISVPKGLRTGYEFFGWYKDEACTDVFTENEQIRGGSPYNKETDFTDPMDKWGNGATTNNDINRFWITEKVDLYAKWSEVIIGADGIGIIYDAAGGSNAPSDTALYKDNSPVVAGAAPTAPEGKVFDHWVVQTWSGTAYEDTATTVLTGGSFNVLKSDAKITDASTNPPELVDPADVVETGHYSYTVQLKAVYKDKEEATPTHIAWYSNFGTENEGKGTLYRYDRKENGVDALQINEAVVIYGKGEGESIPTREGYSFIGWTKTKGGTTADFLVWDGEQYMTPDESGYVANYVAADEKNPIEDLFAVWAPKLEIKITGNSDSVLYNGNQQTVSGFTVEYKIGSEDWSTTAPEGVTVALADGINAEAQGTNVGNYPMGLTKDSFTVTAPDYIFNAESDLSVTDGTLTITKRTVTLTSATDSKPYDGTALTNDEVTVSGDGFAANEGATYDITGTQTDVGSSDNEFTYELNEGTNADNYEIADPEFGTLTVT